MLIAFVDPESQLGAALTRRIIDDIFAVETRELTCWRRAIGAGSTISESRVEAWVREWLLNGEAR